MPDQPTAWDRLSAKTAQVLFCDLQKAIVMHSVTTPLRALASSAGALFQLARLFELPAILSVVPDGTDARQVIAELEQADGFAPTLPRVTNSLFGDPATLQAIGRADRKVLIVAGFMLEAVVLDTVLDARAAGYEVLVAVDACGSPCARTEQAVLRQMESVGATPTSVVSIGTKLAADFTSEAGSKMFSIVQGIQYT